MIGLAPQPLEGRLKTSKWVSEAVLLGDRQPYIVSLIVPNFSNLEAEARSRGRAFASHRDLIGQPEIRSLIQAEVDKVNGDLAPFEKGDQHGAFLNVVRRFLQEFDPSVSVDSMNCLTHCLVSGSKVNTKWTSPKRPSRKLQQPNKLRLLNRF